MWDIPFNFSFRYIKKNQANLLFYRILVKFYFLLLCRWYHIQKIQAYKFKLEKLVSFTVAIQMYKFDLKDQKRISSLEVKFLYICGTNVLESVYVVSYEISNVFIIVEKGGNHRWTSSSKWVQIYEYKYVALVPS